MPRKKITNDAAADLAGGVLRVPRPAAANGQAADATHDPASQTTAASPPEPTDDTPSPATADSAAGTEARETTESRETKNDGHGEHDPMPDAFIGHRPLIRATLPRTENDVPPPRAIPEFTMHQRPGRGFGGRGFRPHGFGGHGAGNGSAPPREGNGPDGNRDARPGGKSRHRRRHRRPR